MNRLIKKLWERHRYLPLDQQIFNKVSIILTVASLLAGVQAFFVDSPIWFPMMFIGSSAVGIMLLWLSNFKGLFKTSRVLFILFIYSLTVLGWFYNGGVNGTAVLVIIATIIFTIGFYSDKYLELLILNIVTFSLLTLINYWYPNTILLPYKNEAHHVVDMITSYVLVASSISFVIITILRSYNRTNKIVIDQKAKLELVYDELAEANNQLVIKNRRLNRKKQQVSQQAKELKQLLSNRDMLFSIIAHDLRGPFNNILGLSEMLIENVKDNEVAESEESLGVINSSAKKSLILLENLLSWAKSQTGQLNFKPEKILLSSIIHDTIEISNSAANIKNISINDNLADEIEAYADVDLLKTVLRNLISNAIKFTQPGGNIKVFVVTDQNQVEITISDNGVGMNDETRKTLFDISTNITSSGTANERGSGLGLVLCKELVELHGGKIWAESVEGKGSDLKFTLPLKKL